MARTARRRRLLPMVAVAAAPMLAIALPSPLAAQPPASRAEATAESTRLRVAREIMTAARFPALVTRAVTGESSARTIDPLLPDSSFVVRFATNPRSRKVREMVRDRRVTLFYFDPATQGYVSLSGTAHIVADPALKRRYWKPEWTPHYSDRSGGVTIVEVIPSRLEVVSVKAGITGDSVTWAAPVVRRFHPSLRER